MRNRLRAAGLPLGGILLMVVVGGAAFVSLSPEFGGTPTKAERRAFEQSGHYRKGEFVNLETTELMTGGSTVSALWQYLFTSVPNQEPAAPLAVRKLDSLTITRKDTALLRATWFGHSASLVEIAGRNILLDPMLSLTMGPHRWLTPKRYSTELPIRPAQLPPIDLVLISHDHYDHLDYQTIRALKDKTTLFCVPLGIGAHLRAWGVAPARIREVSWGDTVQLPGLTVVSTPSRHFSGRGVTNRNSTFWTSWVMQSATKRVFYSGDGGYGTHFKAIGAAYGPFDLALMECGQYNEQWAQIHMMPEQTVQATLDVQGRVLLPVHWGAFTEARHSWTDPIERVTAEAARLHQPITTPRLGESVVLGGKLPGEKWWVGMGN